MQQIRVSKEKLIKTGNSFTSMFWKKYLMKKGEKNLKEEQNLVRKIGNHLLGLNHKSKTKTIQIEGT